MIKKYYIIILLFGIIATCSFSGYFIGEIIANKIYSPRKPIHISIKHIKFTLQHDKRGIYKIHATYLKDIATANHDCTHFINIYDNKGRIVCAGKFYLQYHPHNEVIFTKSWDTSSAKGRYIKVGIAKITNGEIKPIFPQGASFDYWRRTDPSFSCSSITINLPGEIEKFYYE